MGDGVEAVGRGLDRRVEERGAGDPVDPEGALVLPPVVVRREVPAAGVDDESVGAQLPPAPLARERRVPRPHAPTPADRVGEQQHVLAGDRRAAGRLAGETERVLQRLRPPAQLSGENAEDLRERLVGGCALRVEAEAARRHESEDDDDSLVPGQHQRREPVAGPQAVASAAPALALDRDAQVLQRDHVAAHRPRVDAESVGELGAGGDGPGLESLEQLEEARGRRGHAAVKTHIEDRNRPIYGLA